MHVPSQRAMGRDKQSASLELPATGLTRSGAFTAHLRALFAAFLRAFIATDRAFETELLAIHADVFSQLAMLLMQ